jgi:hypothetical protein
LVPKGKKRWMSLPDFLKTYLDNPENLPGASDDKVAEILKGWFSHQEEKRYLSRSPDLKGRPAFDGAGLNQRLEQLEQLLQTRLEHPRLSPLTGNPVSSVGEDLFSRLDRHPVTDVLSEEIKKTLINTLPLDSKKPNEDPNFASKLALFEKILLMDNRYLHSMVRSSEFMERFGRKRVKRVLINPRVGEFGQVRLEDWRPSLPTTGSPALAR